jgi:signal transduction histidine kinase
MNDLPKDLLTLICSPNNPATLLEELAQRIGEGLTVDLCLVLADKKNLDSQESGLWHRSQESLDVDEGILANPLIQNLWTVDHLVAIAELPDSLNWSIPVKAVLGVRTEFQKKANGLILVGLTERYEWTKEQASLLLEIRQQVAIAINLVQLQQECNLTNEPVSVLGSNLFNKNNPPNPSFGSPIIKRLYELMRQQLEQQRQLNEMKDEIIAAISDKARNPLASMKLAMNMLSNPERELPPVLAANYWRILKEEWGNLNDLITHIVTLQQLKAQELTFHPQAIQLESLLDELTGSFREHWGSDRPKKLTLAESWATPLVPLTTDPQHLRVILQELLTNAAHFSYPQTTVYLKVFPLEQSLKISVINTGLGISEEDLPIIFEPFKRGRGITEKAIAGTGIGLTLVKGLVELLGGDIAVSSNPEAEADRYITTFTLTLPSTPPSR